MFTQEDIQRMYEQATGGQQQQRLHIPEEKIALFVERCYKEREVIVEKHFYSRLITF